MMTSGSRPSLLSVSCLAWMCLGLNAAAAQQSAPRMVIELFTSQGCSASPAADAVVRELADQPDVIALSFPVDYWDYLGWKDTLATPFNTARQKAYAELRGDHKIYTPQVVIDGRLHAVGSKRDKIRLLAEKARVEQGALSVPVTAMLQGTTLNISAEAGKGSAPAQAEMIVLGLSRSETVAVEKGENAGRTMTYQNVVRSIHRAGAWQGAPQSWSFDVSALKDPRINAYAVLLQVVQDGKPGVILGGAKVGM